MCLPVDVAGTTPFVASGTHRQGYYWINIGDVLSVDAPYAFEFTGRGSAQLAIRGELVGTEVGVYSELRHGSYHVSLYQSGSLVADLAGVLLQGYKNSVGNSGKT